MRKDITPFDQDGWKINAEDENLVENEGRRRKAIATKTACG